MRTANPDTNNEPSVGCIAVRPENAGGIEHPFGRHFRLEADVAACIVKVKFVCWVKPSRHGSAELTNHSVAEGGKLDAVLANC